MRQILLLVVFVLAARWLVRTMRAAQMQASMRGGSRAGAAAGGARPKQPHGPRQLAEPMVRCAVCGVHAPKSDSIAAGGGYFCSAEHAQRYAARASGREGR
jgi:uncharacterized protein